MAFTLVYHKLVHEHNMHGIYFSVSHVSSWT